VIRYALVCSAGHEFESWFANSAAFEKQAKKGLIGCPHCGNVKIEKALMSPRLARADKGGVAAQPVETLAAPAASAAAPVALMSPQEMEFRSKLKELRDHIVANAEHVGKGFVEEARKMHYGEIERRSIYGEASVEDAVALHEEGIEVQPLPVLPDERN